MQNKCYLRKQRTSGPFQNPNKQLGAACLAVSTDMLAACPMQSACATPRGAAGQGDSPVTPHHVLALMAPLSAAEGQPSPMRQGFPAVDAKSLASLQAAFGQDFVSEHLATKLSKVSWRAQFLALANRGKCPFWASIKAPWLTLLAQPEVGTVNLRMHCHVPCRCKGMQDGSLNGSIAAGWAGHQGCSCTGNARQRGGCSSRCQRACTGWQQQRCRG